MATAKTNAVRLLERLGVPFELRDYEVDPDDLAAETVARRSGCRPSKSSRRWSPVATSTAFAWRSCRAT